MLDQDGYGVRWEPAATGAIDVWINARPDARED
jgi:hypothetical protein